jgi:phenylacetate-CoA ligase
MEYKELREQLYSDIQASMPEEIKKLKWSRKQILDNQQIELRKLISYAKQNSSWHRDRLKQFNADTFDLQDITKLPYMTKDDVMDNWNDIITCKKITMEKANVHLAKIREGETDNPYFLDRYVFFATGGSSGKRGLFVWDKKDHVTFGKISFRYEYENELKNKVKNKKVAVLVSPSLLHASSFLFSIRIENGTQHLICPTDLPINVICEKLNEFQPTHLNGFSSLMKPLSLLALKGELNINPKRVTVHSELLDNEGEKTIKQAWGIDAIIQWGSVETGIAASGANLTQGSFLAEDYIIFETVDEEFLPTNDIDKIRKVLVTNLFSYPLPLIRYALDDILKIQEADENISGYRILKSIQGRADNYFNYYNRVKVHPIVFRHVLGQYSEIIEYQVSQSENGANVFYIANKSLTEAFNQQIKNELLTGLAKAGLKDPKITVKQTDKLKRHYETGKFSRFIPFRK